MYFEVVLKMLKCALQGTRLPPVLKIGGASVSGSMVGSHAAPRIAGEWSAPDAQAHGTVALNSNSTRVTCQAPSINAAATLFTQPSDYEAMKNITTQVDHYSHQEITTSNNILVNGGTIFQ